MAPKAPECRESSAVLRRPMLDTYPVILYAMTQFTDRWFGEERAVIGRLRGVVIEKQPPEVLLEVGGVGYEVQMPMSCFYDLP